MTDEKIRVSNDLDTRDYGSRVAVAFVPAAQVWPPAFEYIARSTTIGRSE